MSSVPSVSVRRMLVGEALLLLVLLFIPTAILGKLLYQLPKRELATYGMLYAAYGVSALAHLLYVRHLRGWQSGIASGLVTSAAFAFAFLAILVLDLAVSPRVVVASFALVLVLLPLLLWGRASRLANMAIVALLLGVGVFIARQPSLASAGDGKQVTTRTLVSAFYPLEIKTYTGYVPRPPARGGGLALIGDEVLLGTGDGYFYRLSATAEALSAVKLPLRVPINGEEFAAAVGGRYTDPVASGSGKTARIQPWRFRVADILIHQTAEHVRLYASHHYWYADRRCYVVRVSSMDLPWPLPATVRNDWQTLYESEPCLPLAGPQIDRNPNLHLFLGEEIGGRLALLDEHTMLLTIGSHGLDGLASDYVPAQDPTASYGKTIAIDLPTRQSRVYSLGHRNPQGLFVDAAGTIWETEHGARGGDELNIIQPNTNYGWPRVTYGTEYHQYVWPLSQRQGHHDGYEQPLYTWLPSIGTSNLIGITHDRFPAWRGDLLVGSLVGRSLHRIKVENRRVILVEPLPIDLRVRDLVELPDGTLLIWADGGILTTIAPAIDTGPRLVFGVTCGGCHPVVNGKTHHAGPDLQGVLGRDIASTDFAAYSTALREEPGEWTRDKLDQFLRDPQAFAPGTTMMLTGIDDAAQRRALIDFLASGHSASDDAAR